jgi:hypothetical protein
MKYLVSTTPGPMPPTPEQFDEAIAWIEERVEDGTADAAYGFLEGGGCGIVNANSHREVLDQMAAYPIFGLVTFEVRPLLELGEGTDTIRAKLAEAQESIAGS